MQAHHFTGKWITDGEFYALAPRNVFHKQLERVSLPCDAHRDRHILFRRTFYLPEGVPRGVRIYITADDYYRLYINGRFVSAGPAPDYPSALTYNEVDVTDCLVPGKNVLAVHTLYQGLINRVWVSGDQRHGLLFDLCAGEEVLLCSDTRVLTHPHTAYSEVGVVGYQTQFMERYDAGAREVGFQAPDFDDSGWEAAKERLYTDYTVVPANTPSLVYERITPVLTRASSDGRELFYDFGACYVGYLLVTAKGEAGEEIMVRFAQELCEDGSIRYRLRAGCVYEEPFVLSGETDTLDPFDYKSFRYATLTLPPHCTVQEVWLCARHAPFVQKVSLRGEYAKDSRLQAVWELCVRTQKYGVQEVIQDCMEREKGFYVGDGCYSVLAREVLTGDDSMTRKLIDDAFRSTFITPGMVTCLDCSMMQEIAEYPLILVSLILWHYRLSGDRDYLASLYPKICTLLETYRRDYEREGLLCALDKWCVVEWPDNFRDGYAVDIREGQVCSEPHVAINAYYLEAVETANRIAALLGLAPYRDASPLKNAFIAAFYDETRGLFCDGKHARHVSYIGNVFPYAFRLCPDARCEKNIEAMIRERGITGVSFFGAFPLMYGLIRHGKRGWLYDMLTDEGAWLRMLREGATTTFEGWGKDTKWNTSLFHMTMSDAAVFLSDIDLENLFL